MTFGIRICNYVLLVGPLICPPEQLSTWSIIYFLTYYFADVFFVDQSKCWLWILSTMFFVDHNLCRSYYLADIIFVDHVCYWSSQLSTLLSVGHEFCRAYYFSTILSSYLFVPTLSNEWPRVCFSVWPFSRINSFFPSTLGGLITNKGLCSYNT